MTPRRFAVLVLAVAWAVLPARARVDVTLDADSLNELLAGWRPDQEAELQGVVDRLGRDLVSAIPVPPALASS